MKLPEDAILIINLFYSKVCVATCDAIGVVKKLNFHESQILIHRTLHVHQVRGLPTLFFISPDPKKDAIRAEGLIPIQMMRDIIDKEM